MAGGTDILLLAKQLATRAGEEADKLGVRLTISVVDIHGNIVLKERMTGSPFHSIELSERKAYTAAAVGMPTVELLPLVQPGQRLFSFISASGGRYVALGGGVPIRTDGVLVGGIGISGGTTAQDTEIAAAIVAASA